MKSLLLIAVLSVAASMCVGQNKSHFNDNSIPEWTYEKVNGKMVWVHNIRIVKLPPLNTDMGKSFKDTISKKVRK